jgi:tape measure domain-containing protein
MVLENAGLKVGTLEAEKLFRELKSKAEGAGNDIDRTFQRVGKTLGALGLSVGVTELGRSIVQVRGQFQQLEIAFGTMLKSGEKAKALMSDLSEFAATTPFGLQSSASAAKQLLAYGSSVETLIDEMRMLGDVAAGTSQPIGDLVYLYGTLRTQGRAYMMDIRQFAGRGIPIYDELAKVLGTTKDRVNEFVSAGKVGFAEVEQAFKNMTQSGGMYGGLMEAQSKSVTGRMEQLKDAIDIMFNEIGKASEGAIYSAISGAASLVENYEQVGKILIGLVSTYGTYRAALIFTTAATKGWTASELLHYNVLVIVEKAQKLLNKTMLANPYVLLATLAVGLVATMWALRDSTTAAERAQEKYNKQKEEAAKKEEEHRNEIEKLIDSATNQYLADQLRIGALEELIKKYPQIFGQYDIESIKLADILSLKKQIAELDAESKRQEISGDYDTAVKNYDDTLKYVESLRKRIGVANFQERGSLKNELKNAERKLEGYYKDLQNYGGDFANSEINKFISTIPRMTDQAIKSSIPTIKTELERMKSVGDEYSLKFQGAFGRMLSVENLESLLRNFENELTKRVDGGTETNLSGIISQIKALESEQSKLYSQKSWTKNEEKRLSSIKEELDGLTKQYQKLTGNQWGKEQEKLRKDAEKEKEDADRKAKELSNLRAQLASDAAQAEIDAMRDGLDKILRQNAENYRRRIEQINKDEAELLRAKKDAQGEDSVLSQSDLDGFQTQRNTAEIEKLRADNKAREDAQNDALDDFRSFEQEYLRLYSEYQEKRKKAQENGADEAGLANADFEFNENIKNLAADFAESNTQFKEWADGIKQIADGALDDGATTVIDASIKQIEDILSSAKLQLASIEDGGVNSGEGEAYGQALARIVALEKELASLRGKNTVKKTDSDWKKAYSTLQKVSNEFEEIGDQIGGTAGDAIKLAGTIASSTIFMIDGIKDVTGAAAASMTALEKASVILAVVGAAMKVVTAITGLFKSNDQALRDAADSTRGYNAALKELAITQRLDMFDTVFGENSLEKFNEATKLAFETLEKLQEQIDGMKVDPNSFFERLGDNFNVKDIRRVIDEINGIEATYDGRSGWNKLIGSGNHKIKNYLFDINEYINADGSLKLKKITDWFNAYQDGLDDAEKQALEDLIANGEAFNQAIEAQTAYVEQLWGDVASSIADNMIEAFLETGDAAANLEDVVSDVAKNMAKSMIMKELMDGIFNNDLKNKLTDLLKSGDQVGANNLMEGAIKRAGELAPYFESIMESVGLIAGTAEDAARTSASQGFAQASQDSIDKIDGILTNIQNHTYGIFELMKAGSPSGSPVTFAGLEAPVNNIADMMRDNQARQQANTDAVLGHLAGIHTNTNRLEAIENYLMNSNRRLDDISDGITQLNRS